MLPLSNSAAAVLEPAVQPHSRGFVPSLNGKVLLIEDEAVIALDMANDLEAWSYKVIGVAGTMERALRAAEQFRPHIAIVDIMLSGDHDGIEIAEALKERFGTQIIFLTGHSNQETRLRVVKLNPIGFLFKPYLAYTLRQLLETYEIQ